MNFCGEESKNLLSVEYGISWEEAGQNYSRQ